MNTVEDVINYLESELRESYSKYGFWKDRDENEAEKYLIAAHEIEHLIDEIKTNTSNCAPAKILVSVPKQKPSFLTIYVNIYSFVLFVSSLLFMSGLIDRLLAPFEFFQGFAGTLITYAYYIVHVISFALFSLYANRTFKTEEI